MKKILILGLFLLCPQLAQAQTSRNPCYTTGAQTTQGIPNCISVGTSTPLPVTVTGAGGSAGVVSNANSGVATTSTNLPTASYGYLWNGLTWDQSTGLLTGTAGAPGVDVITVQSPITLGSAGFPAASTPIGGNASGTTGAVVGTLAANATKTTYICGFNVQAVGGTAAVGPITIAGLITASQVYQASATAAGGTVASASFTPCIPASAINTAITITTTADGTATAVNVNSWGFQQ